MSDFTLFDKDDDRNIVFKLISAFFVATLMMLVSPYIFANHLNGTGGILGKFACGIICLVWTGFFVPLFLIWLLALIVTWCTLVVIGLILFLVSLDFAITVMLMIFGGSFHVPYVIQVFILAYQTWPY